MKESSLLYVALGLRLQSLESRLSRFGFRVHIQQVSDKTRQQDGDSTTNANVSLARHGKARRKLHVNMLKEFSWGSLLSITNIVHGFGLAWFGYDRPNNLSNRLHST